jgi:hypothetical protein
LAAHSRLYRVDALLQRIDEIENRDDDVGWYDHVDRFRHRCVMIDHGKAERSLPQLLPERPQPQPIEEAPLLPVARDRPKPKGRGRRAFQSADLNRQRSLAPAASAHGGTPERNLDEGQEPKFHPDVRKCRY